MGYLFAAFGFVTAFLAVMITTLALTPPRSDITLILGGVYGVATAIFWVGAGIIFRMDCHYVKKDIPK